MTADPNKLKKMIERVLADGRLSRQEDELTIEANDYLEVAVSHQGNVITPHQVDSDHQPMSSQWFYYPKMQQKHTILVKGNTPKANIRFCLREK